MGKPRYYVRIKGSDYGPLSHTELADLAARGRFTPEDLLWYHRLDHWDWVAAGHIAELQGLFADLATEELEISQALAEAKRIKAADVAVGRKPTQLLAFGGGKGGTGKTSVASAIAISLASLESSVVLIDGDLGGANAHTCLGMTQHDTNLGRFFSATKAELSDLMVPTPIANLQLISGAGGVLGLANPKYSQKLKFINRIRKLRADYVVMDLGAGTTYDTLDLFLAADCGILVSSPDPFSLQNGFNFIKACVYRMLSRRFRNDEEVSAILDAVHKDGYRKPLPAILDEHVWIDSAMVDRMREALSEFRPAFIANMVMKRSEAREALVVKTASAELLGVDVEYFGHVYFDPEVRSALRKMQPFVVANPRCRAARCVLDIVVRKLLGINRSKGFWQKRRMRRQLRKSLRPAVSPDAANEAAIYENPSKTG